MDTPTRSQPTHHAPKPHLSREDVARVKVLATHFPYREVGLLVGLGAASVGNIVRGDSWREWSRESVRDWTREDTAWVVRRLGEIAAGPMGEWERRAVAGIYDVIGPVALGMRKW